jgi:hypothetical protein
MIVNFCLLSCVCCVQSINKGSAVKIAVFAVLLQYLILHKIGVKCGYCGFNHGDIVVARSYAKI